MLSYIKLYVVLLYYFIIIMLLGRAGIGPDLNAFKRPARPSSSGTPSAPSICPRRPRRQRRPSERWRDIEMSGIKALDNTFDIVSVYNI